jgi:hypothetical protein
MRLAGKTNGTSSSGVPAGVHPAKKNTTVDNDKAVGAVLQVPVFLSRSMSYLFVALFLWLHPKIKNNT